MGSLFGGGDDSSSREMIQMQKDEAAEARKKEAERQDRINKGLANIKGIFHGTPVMAPKTFDWKTFNPKTAKAGAVPGMAGYTFVNQAAVPAVAARAAVYGTPGTGDGNTGVGSNNLSQRGTGGGTSVNRVISPAVAGTPGQEGGWFIKGPDGKLHKVGEEVTGSFATDKTKGGIQNSFFDDFKQGILDYYTPQVADQYSDAKDETTYRLARAGTLRSSAANDAAADLYKQNLVNVGDVRNKADAAAADLKTRVNAEEAKANSQLLAGENPEVAASQALHAVTNLSAEKPTTSPLGAIFDVATIGGAKYMQGADNAAMLKKIGGLPKPQTRYV